MTHRLVGGSNIGVRLIRQCDGSYVGVRLMGRCKLQGSW